MAEVFKITRKYQKATDAILAVIAERGRGGRITLGEIESLSGFVRYGDGWNNLIQRLRSRCQREMGAVLICKEKGSLDILTAREQIEIPPQRRTRRAFRQLGRGLREVGCTPDQELSLHQRTVKSHTVESLKTQRRSVRKQARVLESLKPSSAFGFYPRATTAAGS